MKEREYAIQAYFEEYAEIGKHYPELGPWLNLSAVYDLQIPTMWELEKAEEILKEINTKYAPKTGHKYRIVTREVTPWEAVG